jgi:hypothetical protein
MPPSKNLRLPAPFSVVGKISYQPQWYSAPLQALTVNAIKTSAVNNRFRRLLLINETSPFKAFNRISQGDNLRSLLWIGPFEEQLKNYILQQPIFF